MDSHVYTGYRIPPYYDSMIGKLIVHAPTRQEAIAKCRVALAQFTIHGVPTSIPFEQYLLETREFNEGHYNTGFIERIVKDGDFEKQKKQS